MSCDDEINSPKLDKLHGTIVCFTNSLARSKEKVKSLQKESKAFEEETSYLLLAKFKRETYPKLKDLKERIPL